VQVIGHCKTTTNKMKLLGLTLGFLLLFTSCKESKNEAFDINLLPNDWVKLTEKDGKLVV
jgi:imidazoleglycerol phosphate synthase glutamine amidotransferase subunit HisH